MTKTKLALVFCALVVAPFIVAAQDSATNGTRMVHLFTQTPFTKLDGTEPSKGAGTVQAKQNTQGGADNQTVDIRVQKLDALTTYQLKSGVRSQDQIIVWQDVATFTTSETGEAVIRYRNMGQGKKTLPLPLELTPVSKVELLGIFAPAVTSDTAEMQPLMVADLTNPSQLQNLESRVVGYGNSLAYLRVEATLDGGTLRFQVYGLQSGAEYTLFLNDVDLQTVYADQNGTALFLVTVADPTDLLGVVECKVEDSDGNVVFLSAL